MDQEAGSAPPGRPEPPPSPSGGSSVGLVALGLLAIGAAAVFWAGLTLGGGSAGRNDDERAAIAAFTETYQRIADDFVGSPLPDAVLEGAIEGMFDALGDPYSRYMSPTEFSAAVDEARGQFEGVGAVMAVEDAAGESCAQIDDGCGLHVLQLLSGAPAEAAGLLAGDVVTAVDGTALAGSTIDDAVRLIRGPRGSVVTLTVERAGESLELPITRDTVATEDVHAATLADGRIGYISIDGFSLNAAEDFAGALQGLLDEGVDGLVLDVRDDPGGFVDAAVEISSQFLADGPVFWEEDAQGRQTPVDALGEGLATDGSVRLAVLVNGASASASEILGGALQDAGRARLVGETTFGKGTVQEWSELPADAGGYRLSIAKWLTRGKRWIDREGLTPDLVVADEGVRYRPGLDGADPALDAQLQAAVALLLAEPPGSLAPKASPIGD